MRQSNIKLIRHLATVSRFIRSVDLEFVYWWIAKFKAIYDQTKLLWNPLQINIKSLIFFVNSSTSPSLPALSSPDSTTMVVSPTLNHSYQSGAVVSNGQKGFTSGYVSQNEAPPVSLTPQPFAAYPAGATYGASTPTAGDAPGVYQQPYYVYTTPYSTMHLQQPYESRMVSTLTFFNQFNSAEKIIFCSILRLCMHIFSHL